MAEQSGDPDMMAAEMALGLLDGDERATAMRRMLAEPGFAREVEQWRDRFATLFASYEDVAPHDEVERRLAAAIAPRRDYWRAGTAIASALAACLLLFVMVRPAQQAPVAVPTTLPARPAILVAALAPTAKGPPVAAIYDRSAGEVRIASASLAPKGNSAQLWVIAGDGVPHSLGLLADATPTRIVLTSASRARLSAGATLAVSVEPIGGSPTGLPTGPVVAAGALNIT